jgi:hypothetical protein
MSEPKPVRALIERLEKLTGPDREVDLMIAQVVLGRSIGVARFTASIDAAVALVERVLPGWGYRVAKCSVSDDAWVFPDFNCPVHGERLRREFRQDVDWTGITDVDLRPSGREPIALILSMLFALEALHAG